MIYHVSQTGNDASVGSADAPFRTIGRAAKVAAPGDVVRVHSGTYREWVDPKNGGLSDSCRITYEAAEGEHPVIKGSELVTDWEHLEGSVYRKALPNTLFGDFNPFRERIEGDWSRYPREKGYFAHLGDVYLNGVSLFEAPTLEELYRAERRERGFSSVSMITDEVILHPEQTVYQWYAEVGETETVLYCNFADKDPNRETVEVSVRKACFFPKKTGVNYVTLRGFEIAQAASPWCPPTAEQIGMVGPHWSKGWIIEDNHLHDAKCSAISLGKETSTGENYAFRFGRKSAHRYQVETVFSALRSGWSKDTVGSHVVRNNVIHDCGQNGIVGNLGSVFSRIEHNHIYNISTKREFWGHEMGGIKLHAPIDVVIENNNIHDCTYGTWLDWQVQGTRITRNLYHNNSCDLYVEITHGPCTVDRNLFLSPLSLGNHAQGTAYVHNLVVGCYRHREQRERATPYHMPHSTAVAGYVAVYGGDDRVLNNLLCGTVEPPEKFTNLSDCYDKYLTAEEYRERLNPGSRHVDVKTFLATPQPVWVSGNAYGGFARPFRAETDAVTADGMTASVEEENGVWTLTLTVPESVVNAAVSPVTTERLGMPRVTEERYESPDGTPLDLTRDLLGNPYGEQILPGPFADLKPGTQRITVWQ